MIPQDFIQRMPFLVRPRNIAHYENGKVYILDRRVYPFETRFVECVSYEEVACAIEDMVTQSLGPAYAAACGMILAAKQGENKKEHDLLNYLEKAAYRIIHTRPTNHEIRDTVLGSMAFFKTHYMDKNRSGEELFQEYLDWMITKRHHDSMNLGRFGASVLQDGDTILTHCWPETTLIYTVMEALQQGKKIKAYCGETRPYLQGSRLTATALLHMGISVTVITDNMPATLLAQGKIQVFLAGSDRTTLDGHVINKVGTLQIAICAKHFQVPFYAFAYGPDSQAKTPRDVPIEDRNPTEVLQIRGLPTASPKATAVYPAFDITPPEFITGIITDKGVYSPEQIGDYLIKP
jgi:methylthioribose-1-phosphate isomerase